MLTSLFIRSFVPRPAHLLVAAMTLSLAGCGPSGMPGFGRSDAEAPLLPPPAGNSAIETSDLSATPNEIGGGGIKVALP